MTKMTKIALNGSRDIPFNQLVLSQANVRRVGGEVIVGEALLPGIPEVLVDRRAANLGATSEVACAGPLTR